MYRSLNPATEELLEEFACHDDRAVAEAVGRATEAFRDWRALAMDERGAVLRQLADRIEAERDALGALMTEEMGKPLAQGVAEAEKCAWVCRYYADVAETELAPRAAESDGSEAWVRREPLGTVLAIMPWNFPFWQALRAAAPALALGNVMLLKHAPNTPRCAARIEALFDSCAPAGVFQNLYLTNEQAGRLVADPGIQGVTLTGSTRAGAAVAAAAGRSLKPMVAELGGSDPFIVLDDANLEQAVEVGVAARLLNNGQSCIAAKRFLVAGSRAGEFTDRFVAAMERQVVGDPADAATTVGPLARADLRDQLAAQVDASKAAGGHALLGAAPSEGRGFYYPPTVLTDIRPGSPAAVEEMFGPVATITSFGSDAEALALANGTAFGLGASVWTEDRTRAERWIPALEAGSVFVNGMVKSDPRLPFGGIKESGFGRELGPEALFEFANTKTVWIR